MSYNFSHETFLSMNVGTSNEHEFPVKVRFSWTPGTNFTIHSASLEPNDPPELEILEIIFEGAKKKEENVAISNFLYNTLWDDTELKDELFMVANDGTDWKYEN
jgi:hypothetical protein